jgi:hypothetical protein
MQWPAMALSVLASWLVASEQRRKRGWGFWVFIVSNVLWVAWGLHSGAPALVALQFCLAAMNIRGAFKAEAPKDDAKAAQAQAGH